MPVVTKDARSDLYGNAVLLEATRQNIAFAFAPQGAIGYPIGHNPQDRNHGFAYDLRPEGDTPGHSLWFGATRSGKGVSGIIPTLLTAISSVVVIDPKGENAWITAPRRRQMGNRTVILDPWGEVNRRYGDQVGEVEEVTKFNPLSALDPSSRNFADDVAAIGDALIVSNPDLASHWLESAKDLIAGLVAAVVEMNPGKASLRDVRDLITSDDGELVAYIHEIRKRNPKSLAARKLRRFAKTNKQGEPVVSDEIGSIRSTAETQTALFDSETLLDAMETDENPFDLEDLAHHCVSLYLVLPPDRLSTHGRWLRMILTLALRMIARQPKPPALPTLFVLDEMGTIGGLRMIEDSYGLLAGLGVRIAGYLQDLNQLQRDYPRSWETFISNSSVIGLLQCADQTTSKYFSEYLGTGTVEVNQGDVLKTRPDNLGPSGDPNARRGVFTEALLGAAGNLKASGGGNNMLTTRAEYTQRQVWEPELSFHPRPVLLPQEVRDSPKDSLIVIAPGRGNMRLKRFVYYSDPVLSPWARHDPNKPAPKIDHSSFPPPPVQPPPPQPSPTQSVADAASEIGGFLKRKLGEKLGGKA